MKMYPVILRLTIRDFTNIRLSNRVTGNSALSPYYAGADFTGTNSDGDGFAAPDGDGLTYANVVAVPVDGVLYAEPPAEYFDFPSDVFEDDGSYVIKAWAEDDDGTRISPVASIELSVREGDPRTSQYLGYVVTEATDGDLKTVAAFRTWQTTDDNPGLMLNVHGFSIQDE